MKQKTLPNRLRHVALLCLMLVGSGNVLGTEYELVTSTSGLTAGCKYIIGSAKTGSAVFMSTATNANNRKVTSSATITNSKVTLTDEMLVLQLGGSVGAWTFLTTNYMGTNGYLASALASATNKNYCRVINASTTATISFDDDAAAVITLQPHESRNILRYNSSATLFACYSSGQNPVYLYKEVVNANQVATPTFSPEATGTFFDAQSVEITTTTEGATIYYTTDGTEPTTSSSVYTAALNVSSTTTIKALATKSGMTDSEVATATYTFGPTFSSLDDLVAADITSGTTVRVSFENVAITEVLSNQLFLNVKKGDHDIDIYYPSKEVPSGWKVGDVVSGTMTCPWKQFGVLWELSPAENTWAWNNLTYTAKTLQSLTVSGTPNRTTYENGETLNPAGLTVTAKYNVGADEDVTDKVEWTFDPETLSAGNTSCEVTAIVDGISSEPYSVTGLTVNASRILTSVVVSGTPTKTVYEVGEVFEPAGLAVTANYSVGDPVVVTDEAEFTYDTTPLTYGTTSVGVTATYNEMVSTSLVCPITVNKKESSITIADMEVGKGATVTISATTTPEEAELIYSITSGSEFVTIEGDEITGIATGTAVINAHFDGNSEYAAADKTFNVMVSATTKDKLVASMFEATTTTYKDFSDVTATSSAVYAGNSAKTNDGGIQLRSKNSSGIVSTTSGGFVRSLTVTFESGNERLDIYGSNTPYSNASDLYSSATQGDKIATIDGGGTYTITSGDYAYIGIRSNDGARYITSIEIAWEAPKTYTVTISGTAESEEDCGVTTLYLDYATEIPAECKAYYAGSAADGVVNLVKAVDYVAANQGVLVYGKKGTDFTFVQTGTEVTDPTSNLFIGATTTSETPCIAADNIFYLSTDGTFKQLIGGTRKAYKAYLNIDAPATKGFTLNFDEETNINAVDSNAPTNDTIFNLAGQRINKLHKGINIINGKKVLY